uniref:GSVIVT00032933001, SOR n=1 Tax=Arundo donax TaxID=35708 RepID=A0A0A9FSC1_ARUDO
MDQVHTVLGGVQLLLHAPGVWFLQGPPKEPLLPGHSWTDRIPYRHCCEIFRGVP